MRKRERKKSVIYVIRRLHDLKVIYVGSSNNIEERIRKHNFSIDNGSKCKIHQEMKRLGEYNILFEVIHEFITVKTKKELALYEGCYQRIYPDLFNRQIAGRTKKIYYNDHKQKLTENMRLYYKNHKEVFKIYNKDYRENNKEQIKISKKQYYENNKEELIEKNKTKYTCSCGSTLRLCDKARHNRSLKHLSKSRD